MTTAGLIALCAGETGLPFVVIGGIAVNAHGYARDTADLDYIVRRTDRNAWHRALARHDYELVHEHENFAQFVSKRGWIDLDLMFVNDSTFDGILSASQLRNIGTVAARFPSLEHLVALKLHAAKQDLPHRTFGDIDDIINLVLANGADLGEEKWRALFTKYGTLELYEKVLRATRS
jgi:hypothetical protein